MDGHVGVCGSGTCYFVSIHIDYHLYQYHATFAMLLSVGITGYPLSNIMLVRSGDTAAYVCCTHVRLLHTLSILSVERYPYKPTASQLFLVLSDTRVSVCLSCMGMSHNADYYGSA